MVKGKQQLFEALSVEGIPVDPEIFWRNTVRGRVKHTCQSPEVLFEAFTREPEAFPEASQLLILWSTNGDSITAYLRNDKLFIRWHLEDGPDEYRVLGETYQQLISEVVAKEIGYADADGEHLRQLANELCFKYAEELKAFVRSGADWEEGAAEFVRSIERPLID